MLAVLAAIAVPVSLATVDRSRGWAAARFLASRMVRARALAIARGASVALRFDGDGLLADMSTFADANRNGVLTKEMDAGVDPRIDGPHRVSSLFAGVALDLAGGAPRVFSFSPDGTATSGTLYMTSRDHSRFAVRVLGTTARVRVLQYIPAQAAWVEVF